MTPRELQLAGARSLALAALLLPVLAGADPEIYRCPQPDGSVAFQGMPCPGETTVTGDEEVPAELDDTEALAELDDEAFVNPFDLPVEAQYTDAERSAVEIPEALSADRSACEESTRRAIDAIDAELAAHTAAGDAKSRLDELLALTRQLRACKTL